jgi:adenylylsulfate kinase-like enzyme
MIVLFFGQPASGKTTLADLFVKNSMQINLSRGFIRMDGDEWRALTGNTNYSKEGRIRNLMSAFDSALFLEKKGFVPVLSFVAPYEEARKQLQKAESLMEIYLHYEGDRGRNDYFVNDFELPKGQNLIEIDTSKNSIHQSLNIVRRIYNSKCF